MAAGGFAVSLRVLPKAFKRVKPQITKPNAPNNIDVALSGARRGDSYGLERLNRLAKTINENKFPEKVLFATDSTDAIRILKAAEKQTGLATNAATLVDNGTTFVIFRNRQVTTAEVMEEMRHLWQARCGFWQKGFVAREIEAGSYLWRLGRAKGGLLSDQDIRETIANVMAHTGLTEDQVVYVLTKGVN